MENKPPKLLEIHSLLRRPHLLRTNHLPVLPSRTPWIAIPNVLRILTGSVDPKLGIPVYKTLFDFLSPNQSALPPACTQTIPWLVFLYAFKIWKWKALPVAIIPVGTWFSAIYPGEHYFSDVIAGIAYATIAYLAVTKNPSPTCQQK